MAPRAPELSVASRPRAELAVGEVRLTVERFLLTANNRTYVTLGDSAGYWTPFPAPEGYGRVPAWGFAVVSESAHPDIAVGSRYFGLLPMSTDLVVSPEVVPGGFRDASPHRDRLDEYYRQYRSADTNGGEGGEPNVEASLRVLAWTVYPSSLVLAHELRTFGAAAVVLSSASSKTALGTAERLRRFGIRTHGMTSLANVDFVRGFGVYDSVSTYDDPAGVGDPDGPVDTVFVDITRNVDVIAAVHHRLGGRLLRSVLFGGTHGGGSAAPGTLAGPTPEPLFVPERRAMLRQRIGEEAYTRELAEGQELFLALAARSMRVDDRVGPDAARDALSEVLAGPQAPDVVTVVRPQPS